MKLFELSYSNYESYESTLYGHNDKTKTKLDFEKDVQFLMRKYANEYLKKSASWCGIDDSISFISLKLNDLGYELLRPKVYNITGGLIISGKENEDERKLIIDFMGADLYNNCIIHNEKIKNKLYKIRNEK